MLNSIFDKSFSRRFYEARPAALLHPIPPIPAHQRLFFYSINLSPKSCRDPTNGPFRSHGWEQGST
uniref:Uncharacterized protein n=1 Tax=Rhizophora mucronata TaxID=61149 RepID=A0A2P2NRF9_RHIMU